MRCVAAGPSERPVKAAASATAVGGRRRAGPGGVQFVSTGYDVGGDPGYGASDLLSCNSSVGSGVILASDGWLVTNAHVVRAVAGSVSSLVKTPQSLRGQGAEAGEWISRLVWIPL